jgi:hypothetical protein
MDENKHLFDHHNDNVNNGIVKRTDILFILKSLSRFRNSERVTNDGKHKITLLNKAILFTWKVSNYEIYILYMSLKR